MKLLEFFRYQEKNYHINLIAALREEAGLPSIFSRTLNRRCDDVFVSSRGRQNTSDRIICLQGVEFYFVDS